VGKSYPCSRPRSYLIDGYLGILRVLFLGRCISPITIHSPALLEILRCTSELCLVPVYSYSLTHLASSLFQALPSPHYRISRLAIPRSIRRRYTISNPILSRTPTRQDHSTPLFTSRPLERQVRLLQSFNVTIRVFIQPPRGQISPRRCVVSFHQSHYAGTR
jgi:hypothetical protein